MFQGSDTLPLDGLSEVLEDSKDTLIDAYIDILKEYQDNEIVQAMQSPWVCALLLNVEILGGVVAKNKGGGVVKYNVVTIG